MGDSSGLACIRQSLSKLYRFLYIIESKHFCQRFLSGYWALLTSCRDFLNLVITTLTLTDEESGKLCFIFTLALRSKCYYATVPTSNIRCSSTSLSVISQIYAKIWKAFLQFFLSPKAERSPVTTTFYTPLLCSLYIQTILR